ncbi:transmembrane protein 245-like isoform X2 [Ostrea edulis]|uniref:transmembrane protein 245-like isoform X2 n=1 Tax=Ostrea edulis TaxID=37623 RepID=UPI002094A00F|nr:transmembrane protein 245-like isoform X2 [Ostrea edulis]
MADFKSPFVNSMLQTLSQGHEKAFKQALYTTAANIFVLLAGASAIAVYFILEAFLRPLLWSVLCGTFLYPFKRELTGILRRWLRGLQDSGTPFAIGIAYIPIQALDSTYVMIFDRTIVRHWKLLCGGIISLFLIYVLWYFGPVRRIIEICYAVFIFVSEVLDYFTSFWVWSLVIAYVIMVIFLWNAESRSYLRLLSLPVWGVLILHIATVAGSLRVPLFMLIIGLIATGFAAEVKETKRKVEDQGQTISDVKAIWLVFTGDLEKTLGKAQQSEKETLETSASSAEASSTESFCDVADISQKPGDIKKPTDLPIADPNNTQGSTTPNVRSLRQKNVRVTEEKGPVSTVYFVYLFWALVLTRVWMNIWLLQLLVPVLALMWIFKALVYQLKPRGFFGGKVEACKLAALEWYAPRKDVLAPRWVIGLLKLLSRGDAKMMSLLEGSLDKVTSILFILVLLVGSTLFTVFFAVQVHQESMHLFRISSNVLNSTREYAEWLPKGEDMQVAMDSMVGNAYLYGRKWIAAKVHDLVGGQDGSNDTKIENKVLEVWDNLYHSWLAKGASNHSVAKTSFQIIPHEVTDWRSIYEFGMQGSFNYSQVLEFVKDNLGTFMSVMENVLIVLKGNMSLVLSIATAALSIILGGGTAILNFIISAAIFLTTLFYLLASSGKQFKPMEWISGLNPHPSGSTFSLAVQEAIGGVFMASLKMAAFYGLYTWLTHTLFSINMVFIPSTLAAVLAAVPFLGPYWATLPAVLELWLIQGQGVKGLALFICHILPSYFVDTTILGEIKGGHPYLTGLAIAGGIYWLGLEGAIIGPILLCCFIVAYNVYGSMLTTDGTAYSGGLPGDKVTVSRPRTTGNLSRSVSDIATPSSVKKIVCADG